MTLPPPASARPRGNARISAIATHVPEAILSNEDLSAEFPSWPSQKIFDKTGIKERRIAGPDETALDLGCIAAEKLFEKNNISKSDVDFLLFCTQSPDYILPTSACIMQDRLGLSKSIGALDFNLGCSGFVYGLSLAAGLIASGAATRVLLVTADTYSKFINPRDKSVRTLFGDGAAATLIEAIPDEGQSIGPFVFGTDGAGADRLMVKAGGVRVPTCAATSVEKLDDAGNLRSENNIFMDGGAVLSFTLREVPQVLLKLLDKSGLSADDFDYFVLHQANKFMLDSLQKKMKLPASKVPRHFEDFGNTVSSTIPFVLEHLMAEEKLPSGTRIMVIGFGVGLSWAAGSVTF